MNQQTMLEALYYGAVSPWERSKVTQATAYKKKLQEAGVLHEKLEALLGEEGHQLLDDFLKANTEMEAFIEVEKFQEGFMIGSRLMVEVFSDHRYFE